MNIEQIFQSMEKIAASHRLPEHFKGDLALDLDSLKRFEGRQFVWLLRTSGTVLVPTKLGANPVYITHWLWGNHGQTVKAFHIDGESGAIEKITFEKAEKLILEPPCAVSSTMCREALVETVNGVLNRGQELSIWGVFESPVNEVTAASWDSWRSYFEQKGNFVMGTVMGNAIRFANTKKLRLVA